jgi:ABC-2 type transport system ATP-binding protein
MSIQVLNISKIYTHQKALNNVSFEVGNQEIVGFLGPNGAGKSTMMKILTCYIPPTSGQAKINGYDVVEQGMEVKREIGYLPEHNPLYLDMYVKEFLHFVSGIYKIKQPVQRVKEMIHLTGLEAEQSKKIGALSKGYRQRVGLAQAMIHDPKVLILDEPTTGLDPNQLEEIRALIRELGKQKTVMLSTHIMQEVEAICDRVIIINKGEIVANSDTRSLKQHSNKQVVTVEFDREVDRELLQSIQDITSLVQKADKIWCFESVSTPDLRKLIFDFAVKQHLSILSLTKEDQKMEDVFRNLTS